MSAFHLQFSNEVDFIIIDTTEENIDNSSESFCLNIAAVQGLIQSKFITND